MSWIIVALASVGQATTPAIPVTAPLPTTDSGDPETGDSGGETAVTGSTADTTDTATAALPTGATGADTATAIDTAAPDDTGTPGEDPVLDELTAIAFVYDCATFGWLSGKDGWVSGYVADPWQVTRGSCRPLRDDSTGAWGSGEAVDNHLVQTASGRAWSDHAVEVTLTSFDNDAVGAVFRFRDARNFLLAFFTQDRGPTLGTGVSAHIGASGHLYAIEDGIATEIASTSTTYAIGQPHAIRIEARGDRFVVTLDGDEVMAASHTGPPEGHVGLYSMDNGDVAFDAIRVFVADVGEAEDPAVDAPAAGRANLSGVPPPQCGCGPSDPRGAGWLVLGGLGLLWGRQRASDRDRTALPHP